MKRQCGHNDDLCRRYGCPDSEDWKGDMSGAPRIETEDLVDDWKWNWPFPRLRHWLRTGIWCTHPAWTQWRMIDTGMRQIRWCEHCDKAQIR